MDQSSYLLQPMICAVNRIQFLFYLHMAGFLSKKGIINVATFSVGRASEHFPGTEDRSTAQKIDYGCRKDYLLKPAHPWQPVTQI